MLKLCVAVEEAEMWGRAVLVVLTAVVAACGPLGEQQQLHVGGAINLFSRYGYLSISMRVVPRNDTDPTWIFREPTVDIFRLGSDLVASVGCAVCSKTNSCQFGTRVE
jgi:hypothetical protein